MVHLRDKHMNYNGPYERFMAAGSPGFQPLLWLL